MIDKEAMKCFFGFHDWKYYDLYRTCRRCPKQEQNDKCKKIKKQLRKDGVEIFGE